MIDKENIEICPIARQCLPRFSEVVLTGEGFLTDPIGDQIHLKAKRLTHRYPDRALLHVAHTCALNCRYCFRKNELNDLEADLYIGEFTEAFKYLGAHPEITEVILTGGDPLTLSNKNLKVVLEGLAEISHLKSVRIHTRLAVVLPNRITEGLLEVLVGWPFQMVMSHHFNHPRELTPLVAEKLALIKEAGILQLNQSVLLRGVNDGTEILRELFSELYFHGVISVYLHHPDLAKGTEEFYMSFEEGRKIYNQLRGTLPGPALPDYVFESPNGGGKKRVGFKNHSIKYERCINTVNFTRLPVEIVKIPSFY